MRDVQRLRNASNEIWLNVASSLGVLNGFVNFDNHVLMRLVGVYPVIKRLVPSRYRTMIEGYREAHRQAVLIRHDCRRPLPLPDGVADHILCSHFLEHVYPVEAEEIIRGFFRVLKEGGTIHVIVPDLREQARKYLNMAGGGAPEAADEFVRETLLGKETAGTLRYRLLEFLGGFGLQHRWMYDGPSMTLRLQRAGFTILNTNETPSRHYRQGDGSVHVVVRKPKASLGM